MKPILLLSSITLLGTAVPPRVQAPAPDSPAVEVLELPNPSSCTAKLPRTLEFESGAYSELFAAHWRRALQLSGVPADGKRSCAVEVELEKVPRGHGTLFHSIAKLTCGELKLEVTGIATSEARAHEMAAFSAANAALSELCDATRHRARREYDQKRAERIREIFDPTRCPQRLEIDANDPELAAAVELWWRGFQWGVGEPQPCILISSQKQEDEQIVVRATLECGELAKRAKVEATATGADDRSVKKRLGMQLQTKMREGLCGISYKNPMSCPAMPKQLEAEGRLAARLTRTYAPAAGEAAPLSCKVAHEFEPAKKTDVARRGVASFECAGMPALKFAIQGSDEEQVEKVLAEKFIESLQYRRCPLDQAAGQSARP